MTQKTLNILRKNISDDSSAFFRICDLAEMLYNEGKNKPLAAKIFNLSAERVEIERRLPDADEEKAV